MHSSYNYWIYNVWMQVYRRDALVGLEALISLSIPLGAFSKCCQSVHTGKDLYL